MALTVEENVDLQGSNTLAVPASARYYCVLNSLADGVEAVAYARSHNLTAQVLGEGSNVVLDEDLPGLWLHQRCRGAQLLDETDNSVLVRAAAGENWHAWVKWTLDQGYYGLENLALIPGSVGAAPIQNIGAYGVEVGPCIERVHCRELATGQARVLDRQECQFDYRDSIFKGAYRDRMLVESVVFRLSRTWVPELGYPALTDYIAANNVPTTTAQDVFTAVAAIRRNRLPDPATEPNAGSFFKNPVLDGDTLIQLRAACPGIPAYAQEDGRVKVPAAFLIEQCGFKEREAAVRVHPHHALVIINPQRRTGREILELAASIVSEVYTRFGIALEQEPRSYPDA
jgi:UDP-N-acetylmuramate dehydrogenase